VLRVSPIGTAESFNDGTVMPTHELPAFLPTAKAGGFLRSFGEVAFEIQEVKRG